MRVVIPTFRYQETLAFYRDLLGLPVVAEHDGLGLIKTGQIVILIRQVDAHSRLAPAGHGLYLELIGADLKTIQHRLRSSPDSIVEQDPAGDARTLLVRDPNANLIALIGLLDTSESNLTENWRVTHMKTGFVASLLHEMCFALQQLVDELRGFGLADTRVETFIQARQQMEVLLGKARRAYQSLPDSDEQLSAYERDREQLLSELKHASGALNTQLNGLARLKALEPVREIQKAIGHLRGHIENLGQILA